MRLAIVTDEISQDPLSAIELGREWGIEWFELRMLLGRRFPDVDEGLLHRLCALLGDLGGHISATSPGFFKTPVTDKGVRAALKESFPRALELTRELGADRMIVFASLRPEGERREAEPPAAVRDLVGEMAERAASVGVLCLLENEAICYGDTGLRAAALIRAVGHPNLRLNWDPGNSVHAGSRRPYPDEYVQVKDLVAHVHVKDMAISGEKQVTVAPGDGIIDWRGQLAALQADGYDGFVTVETHFGPKVAASRRSAAWVKARLAELATPQGGSSEASLPSRRLPTVSRDAAKE
jgi:sugar phosphate isomerase/epimerase